MMYTKGVLMHTTSKKNGCGKAYTQNYSVFSVVFRDVFHLAVCLDC